MYDPMNFKKVLHYSKPIVIATIKGYSEPCFIRYRLFQTDNNAKWLKPNISLLNLK